MLINIHRMMPTLMRKRTSYRGHLECTLPLKGCEGRLKFLCMRILKRALSNNNLTFQFITRKDVMSFQRFCCDTTLFFPMTKTVHQVVQTLLSVSHKK